jgi:hypothetical protein
MRPLGSPPLVVGFQFATDAAPSSIRAAAGTGIIKALAHDLNAKVETLAGPEGTIVSITHATLQQR